MTSHGTSRKHLREPEQRNTKGKMATGDFQVCRMGFRPNGKKGQKRELPNGETEKGIPQHVQKKVTSQGLSKESKLKEGKNEKNRKWNLLSDRHGIGSVNHKTKQGNQWFP